jgi:GH24 family phage-related lysozyme (muramidase)
MPFKSEAQRAWMYANHPEMAKRWEKHTPKGRRLPKRLHPKKAVGLSEEVANLFAPMSEGEYPWTKRVSVAGAGVLLGLLAARTLGGKGDYVAPPTPAPIERPQTPRQTPQRAVPSPQRSDPRSTPVPAQEVFQRPALTVQEAKDFIAPNEGTRSKVYRDSRGKKTVGVGFNLNQPGAAKLLRELGINYTAVKSGKRRLTPGEIDALFERKVEDAMAAGPRVLQTFDDHPKEVQLAVVDMIYNLGPTGFSNFDTAVAALDRKDYNRAANAMERSAWYRQVGSRAEKVVSMVRSASDTAANDLFENSVVSTFGGF